MNILYIDRYGKNKLFTDTDIKPSVGDSIDWGYIPSPKVTKVLLHPNPTTQQELKNYYPVTVDIIVTVD